MCGKEPVVTTSNPSDDEVLSLFGGADGALGPEREQAYWRSLGEAGLRVSETYPTGEPIRFWYDLSMWVPAFAQVDGIVRARVDGKEVKAIAAPISSAGYPDGAKLSLRRARIDNAVDLPALAPGDHELEVELHLTVTQTRAKPFIATLIGRARARTRIVETPLSAEPVELAGLAERIEARVHTQEGSPPGSVLWMRVLEPVEVALSYRVELRRAAAVDWTGELLVEPRATPSKQTPVTLDVPLRPGDTIELTLVPDPELITRDPARYGARFAVNRIVRSITVEAFREPRRR